MLLLFPQGIKRLQVRCFHSSTVCSKQKKSQGEQEGRRQGLFVASKAQSPVAHHRRPSELHPHGEDHHKLIPLQMYFRGTCRGPPWLFLGFFYSRMSSRVPSEVKLHKVLSSVPQACVSCLHSLPQRRKKVRRNKTKCNLTHLQQRLETKNT